VELVPPSDNILRDRFGIALPQYLNETKLLELPSVANPQLPAGQDEIIEFEEDENDDSTHDDSTSHRAPVITRDALNKISTYLETSTGFTLEAILNTMSEISNDVIPYKDIDQITYEQISFHLLEQMAICGLPFKVNVIAYDKNKKRHYIPFMAENVLMFTRDKFRQPLKQAGMNEDAIKTFVNRFDKKGINFINDMELPLEILPLIYVKQSIDEQTGEHKYFEIDHIRVADGMVNTETGSFDDIPF
jgi:hypothetical protein